MPAMHLTAPLSQPWCTALTSYYQGVPRIQHTQRARTCNDHLCHSTAPVHDHSSAFPSPLPHPGTQHCSSLLPQAPVASGQNPQALFGQRCSFTRMHGRLHKPQLLPIGQYQTSRSVLHSSLAQGCLDCTLCTVMAAPTPEQRARRNPWVHACTPNCSSVAQPQHRCNLKIWHCSLPRFIQHLELQLASGACWLLQFLRLLLMFSPKPLHEAPAAHTSCPTDYESIAKAAQGPSENLGLSTLRFACSTNHQLSA